jgi:hypothetical protein
MTDQNSQSSSIASSVRQLMRRHGVEERQFSKKLAEVLELSYSQAHRKMGGTVDWTFGQMSIVAEYFGETLRSLAVVGGSPRSVITSSSDHIALDAVFVAGGCEFDCMVTLGEQIFNPRGERYIAVQNGSAWCILESSKFPLGHPAFRVEKVEICVRRKRQPVVAVFDENEGSAMMISDFLNASGFLCTPFHALQELEKFVDEQGFEGFVVAWTSGSQSGEQLIRRIRTRAPVTVPIFLLTDSTSRAKHDDVEIARIVKKFNVVCHRKPVLLEMLAAELALNF